MDFPQTNLAINNAINFRLCWYSMTAPIVRTSAEMTAAHWMADRLFQRDTVATDEHREAERAANIRIWLVITGVRSFPISNPGSLRQVNSFGSEQVVAGIDALRVDVVALIVADQRHAPVSREENQVLVLLLLDTLLAVVLQAFARRQLPSP